MNLSLNKIFKTRNSETNLGQLLKASREGCSFMTDCVTKFHNVIYVMGWFHAASEKLLNVSLCSKGLLYQLSEVGLSHGGVQKAFGPGKGFRIQAIFGKDIFPEDAAVIFETQKRSFAVPLKELAETRNNISPSNKTHSDFIEHVSALKNPKMLDIGGRDRSNFDRSQLFPGVDVTVLDILPGNNVDVVGDAHRLTEYFPPNHFDAIYSVSVFEHLLIPWKVALEMAKVLKPGGRAMIMTHQTLGVHDMPWDFWRYSDNAWAAIFNKKTGFKIIQTIMDREEFILPFIYRPEKEDAEKAAGFEVSCVLVEKICEPLLQWDVKVSELVDTMYPSS